MQNPARVPFPWTRAGRIPRWPFSSIPSFKFFSLYYLTQPPFFVHNLPSLIQPPRGFNGFIGPDSGWHFNIPVIPSQDKYFYDPYVKLRQRSPGFIHFWSSHKIFAMLDESTVSKYFCSSVGWKILSDVPWRDRTHLGGKKRLQLYQFSKCVLKSF